MKLYLLGITLLFLGETWSQAVPAKEENISHLVTFGKQADPAYGDDDNCQVFFFTLPFDFKKPFYLRVYDPDTGGDVDEIKGKADTKVTFGIYGGKGCITHEDARKVNPEGNYKSGNLITEHTFGNDSEFDGNWYTFGPINPTEGEYSERFFGNVFKVIAEGVSGNDGNLYRYFLSASETANIPVEGANAFTYEYTFRLHKDPTQISHVYPYVDNKVLSVKQTNFDWDNDGFIKLYSVATLGKNLEVSGDNDKKESIYQIKSAEKGSSLDIQFQKNKSKTLDNNNVVFYITNQYGEALPFYTAPIGGVPKYKGRAVAMPVRK